MARRVLNIFLILLTGCLFVLNGGQDAHAENIVPLPHHTLKQGAHIGYRYLNDHEERDKPQNLYCRMRTRADVQQNHYLLAVLEAREILKLRDQPEALISVRIHSSNEYFRSFLKRLLFPKHSFW